MEFGIGNAEFGRRGEKCEQVGEAWMLKPTGTFVQNVQYGFAWGRTMLRLKEKG